MPEQTSKQLDILIDDLQRTRKALRRAACLVEGILDSLSLEIEEKRKRETHAIAEIVQESFLSKELPGSRHEISIDGSYFWYTREDGLKPTEPPPDELPF